MASGQSKAKEIEDDLHEELDRLKGLSEPSEGEIFQMEVIKTELASYRPGIVECYAYQKTI